MRRTGKEESAFPVVTRSPSGRIRINGIAEESPLEVSFLLQIKAIGLPIPVRQFKALPDRNFLWDFAWPDFKLLVEINGMTYSRRRGGHSTGTGIARDYLKLDLAILAGWRVLLFDAKMVEDGRALNLTEEVLQRRDEP